MGELNGDKESLVNKLSGCQFGEKITHTAISNTHKNLFKDRSQTETQSLNL